MFKYICVCVFCAGVYSAAFCMADEKADAELEALRQAAQSETGSSDESLSDDNGGAFTSGALALQALNPEISVVGDVLWKSRNGGGPDALSSDFIFRTLGIHAQAYLDPYTRFKAAVEFSEDGTELGEAYMTRFGILPHLNLTLGKFRQQFGVVNRWHKHGLDQVDFPLALRCIFGDDGLNQTGVSLEWTMPDVAGFSQSVLVQVTDGQNDNLFAGNSDNKPSELAHYKMFRDLSASTYAECGFSVLHGENQEWGDADDAVKDALDTFVYGADFTVLWEPTDEMRYRNLTWRSEMYVLNKDILAPDGSGEDTLDAWGLYSYLQSKISRTFIVGMRVDYFVPDTKPYAADDASDFISALAVTESGADRWQITPYITWNQSPFVHFRMEYDYQDGSGTGPDEQTFWLQCIFAAGPHKHERY